MDTNEFANLASQSPFTAQLDNFQLTVKNTEIGINETITGLPQIHSFFYSQYIAWEKFESLPAPLSQIKTDLHNGIDSIEQLAMYNKHRQTRTQLLAHWTNTSNLLKELSPRLVSPDSRIVPFLFSFEKSNDDTQYGAFHYYMNLVDHTRINKNYLAGLLIAHSWLNESINPLKNSIDILHAKYIEINNEISNQLSSFQTKSEEVLRITGLIPIGFVNRLQPRLLLLSNNCNRR